MKYCSNCGAQLTGTEKFCHVCGTKVKRQNEIIENKIEETSVVEEKIETPVVEEKTETPVVEEKIETPVVEEKIETPVVEEKTETPVVEEKTETPVVEEKTETVEEKTETPVVEEKTETPVVEEKVEQPLNNQPEPMQSVPMIEQPKSKSNAGLIVLIIVLVVAIAGAGFLGGYLLFGPKDNTENKENKDDEEDKEEDDEEENNDKEDDKEESSTDIKVGDVTLTIPDEFEYLDQSTGLQITNGEWFGVIIELGVSYNDSKENINVYTTTLETSGFEVISTDIITVNKKEYIEINLKQENIQLVALLTEFDDTTLALTMADIEGGKIDKNWYKEYDNILANSK